MRTGRADTFGRGGVNVAVLVEIDRKPIGVKLGPVLVVVRQLVGGRVTSLPAGGPKSLGVTPD